MKSFVPGIRTFLIQPVFLFFFLSRIIPLAAQPENYKLHIQKHREQYVATHEVVKGDDKKKMCFYDADEDYKVTATIEKIFEAPWFKMETSGKDKKVFRLYALVHFELHSKVLKLHIYQSQHLMTVKEYENYLFIPFTDLTNGEGSYENGRYIDLSADDLSGDKFIIDFNKAYNPYCAYVSNIYNCPVPPAENNLPVAIKAGEMKYGVQH